MYRHLLVPTDHSPLSIQAAEQAVKLAASLGARITFFYAVQAPTILNYIFEATPDLDENPSLLPPSRSVNGCRTWPMATCISC